MYNKFIFAVFNLFHLQVVFPLVWLHFRNLCTLMNTFLMMPIILHWVWFIIWRIVPFDFLIHIYYSLHKRSFHFTFNVSLNRSSLQLFYCTATFSPMLGCSKKLSNKNFPFTLKNWRPSCYLSVFLWKVYAERHLSPEENFQGAEWKCLRRLEGCPPPPPPSTPFQSPPNICCMRCERHIAKYICHCLTHALTNNFVINIQDLLDFFIRKWVHTRIFSTAVEKFEGGYIVFHFLNNDLKS